MIHCPNVINELTMHLLALFLVYAFTPIVFPLHNIIWLSTEQYHILAQYYVRADGTCNQENIGLTDSA